MGRAPARIAAAIHGFFRMSRPRPAPATAIGRIAVLVVKQNLRRSIPAAIVTVMEAGSSIRPASIGAPVLAETAAQQTMTTLRTV